ncbi:TonB-dependent receptor [uncultured Mucilaginibacter sp.]|uniref:TonB-dependent receptor n=1 Tax=uncultured Mucilaginibacter sp. TaxID=797541 RepID=UPI0025CDBEBF|nr:TonB-dependent receptor [uncultured Mucilaginibacter sp.]
MKHTVLFIFLLLCTATVFAQLPARQGGNSKPPLAVREVSGIVKDSTDNTIIGATVKLKAGTDSLTTTTNADGIFVFKNVKSATFVISITSIGYKPVIKRMLNNDAVARLVLDPFVLGVQANQLAAVEVKGPTITYKTDTVEYRASDYKVRPNATVDELLKKMEGMEVGSDGSVTHQGQQVTKAKLNGKDYAGGDLARAIQTLGADIVEKIQVVDDYGDQAARTGIKDGDPQKILNITTRADRSVGNTARINAGAGNNERYETNIDLRRINGNKVLNVSGNLRNTVNGVASSGIAGGADGGRGIGQGGGNAGGGGGSGGTTTSGSPSITYRDQWGKKIEVNLNYRYNFNNVNSINNSYGQTYYQNRLPGGVTSSDTLIFTRNSESQNNSKNHNFTFEMEYSIDSANFLRVTPSFSLSNAVANSFSNRFDTGLRFQDNTGRGISDNSTPNYGGIVFYQHIFKKPRRNASVQLSYTRSNQQQSTENDNNTLFKDSLGNVTRDLNTHRLTTRDNLTRNFRTSITYVEPLSQKSQLEFNAQINRRAYDNNAVIDSITPAGNRVALSSNLNNIFNYSFTESRMALNYRYNQTKFNMSFGVTAVPTNLSGTNVSRGGIETSRNNFFIIPIARFEYAWSRQHRASINYTGAPQEPSFNQIQPIVDSSNRSNPIVGNPNLKVAFRHTINARYNNYLSNSRFTIGANLYGTSVQNQITTNNVRIIDPLDPEKKAFINQTNYVNISGSYSIGGNYTLSKQLADRKYNLALNGSVSYNHTLAMVDNLPTTSNGWRINQRFGPRINPNEWMEVNPFISYDYTKTFLIVSDTKTTSIRRTALAIDGRFFLLKEGSLTIGYDASKNFVSQQGYSSNPLVINAYVEKNFLAKRNLTFRLQVFDLLKQNNFTNQVINDNGFTNTLSNALSRYFMFSVRTNLQKWSGTPMRNGRPMRRRGDGSFF